MTPKQTAELTAQCHRLRATGMKRHRIAEALKIPADTVSVLLSGWGMGRPRVSEEKRSEIAALAKKGLSRRAIAEIVGVSVPTAHKYMAEVAV